MVLAKMCRGCTMISEYNPVSNSWIQKADVTTLLRNEPAYFSIGTKGYIGMGYNSSGPYLKDFWEYTPDSACATGIDEIAEYNLEFSINPNPAKDFISINYLLINDKINTNLAIADVQGRIVFKK
ncbi:MAG: hypothetical protein IPN13_12360 [Bacteroidetes bacterium]|nr:hypothetical protein [Bacteroidota bacterium]